MVWFVLVHLLGFVVDLLIPTRRTDHEKDLQILVLQHQLRLLQRERPQPRHLTRWEKLTLYGPRTSALTLVPLHRGQVVAALHSC
jgi:hypothetical protein